MQITVDKKGLESLLAGLKDFETPKWQLEQLQTPPDIASIMLLEAFYRGDILAKRVADLGCGTGILGLGAAILGAKEVYCVEIDKDALKIAEENKRMLEAIIERELPIIFVNSDVRMFFELVDTVIMNPPFGLERGRRHSDLIFLEKAFEIAHAVYSLHRKHERSRIFLKKFAEDRGFRAEVLGTFRFPLKAIFPWHRKPKMIIEVDFYLFRMIDNLYTKALHQSNQRIQKADLISNYIHKQNGLLFNSFEIE